MTTPAEFQQATDLVRHFYDYLNATAGPEWAARLAPNWTALPPLPATPDQATGYRAAADQLRAGVPDLRVENVEVIANADVVAVRSRVSGTHTGPLFGQAPTDKSFVFTAMDIHRISDGKIAQTWHVEDFAGMLAQLA